jgi:tight adherence protein B
VRIGLVGFGPTLNVLPPSTDRAALTKRLAELRAIGDTALFDAVSAASAAFDSDASDRAIVLLSDGGNSAGTTTLDQALASLGATRLEVIELVTIESNRAILEQLAVAGHGSVTSAGAPSALADVYRRVAASLVNRYRVRYHSAASGEVELTARVLTGGRTAEGSTSFTTPVLVTPSTQAATTAAPEPSSALPIQPPSLPPATTVALAVAPARRLGLSPRVWLAFGAGCFFLSLLLVALLAVPQPGSRASRRRLGIESLTTTATLTQAHQRASGAIDDALSRNGRATWLARALDIGGINLRPGEFVVMTGTAMMVAILVGFVVGGPAIALAFGALVVMAAVAVVDVRGKRRRAQFADDLGATLQLLSSSLRSGYALRQALAAVADEAEEPTRGELGRALVETRLGRPQIDALRAVSERMGCADFEWVVSAIEINRDIGGNLAELLDNVSETVRERQQLFRKVRALSAEGRMSTYIMTGLPVALAAAIRLRNPHYLDPLKSGLGLVAVAVSGSLVVIGWFWMRAMLKVKF